MTIIGAIYLGMGIVGLAYHATELKIHEPFQPGLVWVLLVRLTAVVAGLYLLRGRNWARWLVLIWMAYHVGLSAFHTIGGLLMHLLFLIVFACFLLARKAAEYFRASGRDFARARALSPGSGPTAS